jgi:magnesium-transporting ATPase (P-type)
MIDPPREEAKRAIAACKTAGVAVKMITGDHAVTATAIADQLGLTDPGTEADRRVTVTGRELQDLSDAEMVEVAGQARVFARVAPEQKLRLVEALQAKGHVVAMTGDGVNDAPALKQADIGVAMGITGTEVAKEAADMVLTDDNFATIEAAVEEGRRIFDNLTKFFVWTLPTNGGEALVIMASVVAGTGVALPGLPVQILWINMTTAVLLGLMLAFEGKESDVMMRPPREPDSPILTGILIQRIILVSVLMLIGVFALFLLKKRGGADLAEARTVAVNLIVMIELFYLFNCRSLRHSMRSLGLFSNPWVLGGSAAMIALQLLFTYNPWMNTLFHSAPLPIEDWAVIVAVSLAVSLVVGAEKWLRERSSVRVPAGKGGRG